MRKLDKPTVFENKSVWVHPSQDEKYLPQQTPNLGFLLFSDRRMLRFETKSEAIELGWKEQKRLTVLGEL